MGTAHDQDIDNEVAAANGSDAYNGWANRETWATNLWLSNDQGLDSMVRERIASAVKDERHHWHFDDIAPPTKVWAADAVRDLVNELLNPDEELLDPKTRASMASDLGSLWRVDWFEIAAAFTEE